MEVETPLISKYEGLTIKEEEDMEEDQDMEEEEDEDPLIPINWAEAPWPPVWKPIEKSPQYASGMIYRFVERWPLEDEPEKLDSEFKVPAPAIWEEYDPPDVNYHRTIITFLKQVRESRGYDLDVNAPWFVNSPFYVMTHYLERTDSKAKRLKKEWYHIINFALGQINTNAKPHGKQYARVRVEKIVDAGPFRTKLVTFTVKEVAPPNNVETIQAMVFTGTCRDEYRLIEWRFKPHDE